MGGDVDDEKSATSNLFFVGVPPRARAQTAQPNRMFYGVAAGASADGLLNVDGSKSDMTSPG